MSALLSERGTAALADGRPLRVLMLGRAYPNTLFRTQGLWTERPARQIAKICELQVVAPVPFFPPAPGIGALRQYTRFRGIEHFERRHGIDVHHPRFVIGPGSTWQGIESRTYEIGVRRLVDELYRRRPFDLIHAHYIYPDGVVARRLSQRYEVPYVVTDQAPWRPWLDRRSVRRAAIPAARDAASLTVVSRYLRDTVFHYLGSEVDVRVIPNGVDGDEFSLPRPGEHRDQDQILFVGWVNYNKGIDVLLDSMIKVRQSLPDARLVLAGGSVYRNTWLQEQELRARAAQLDLGVCVEFLGPQDPEEVARLMRTSAVLVLPSRAETFGAVLVEALASGTPVVASRSGGPEDIVTPAVGRLVPTDDPQALADALVDVLSSRSAFPQGGLRAYALARYDWGTIAQRYVDVYCEVLRPS